MSNEESRIVGGEELNKDQIGGCRGDPRSRCWWL